jgi:preprotein translocase subunit SecA
MRAEEVTETVTDMRHEVIENVLARCVPSNAMSEQWDLAALHEECLRLLSLDLPVAEWGKEEGIADEEILQRLLDASDRKMAEKAANYGPAVMRMAEKSLLLQILDHSWKEHLLQLDHLRQGIGLRAYAQRDPLNEYKREAFEMFEEMLGRVRQSVTEILSHVELTFEESEGDIFHRDLPKMAETPEDPALAGSRYAAPEGVELGTATVQTRSAAAVIDSKNPETWGKISRNASCPCGSNKKYKHCHGSAH